MKTTDNLFKVVKRSPTVEGGTRRESGPGHNSLQDRLCIQAGGAGVAFTGARKSEMFSYCKNKGEEETCATLKIERTVPNGCGKSAATSPDPGVERESVSETERDIHPHGHRLSPSLSTMCSVLSSGDWILVSCGSKLLALHSSQSR